MFLDFLCQLNTPNRHGRSLKREQKKPKATEGGVDVPQPEAFAEMDRLLTEDTPFCRTEILGQQNDNQCKEQYR